MSESMPEAKRHLFSIGHSNHSLETFLGLLKTHQIEVLVDARSHPYSKYASHFDNLALKAALSNAGIKYLYLGKELGGRPEGSEFYDADGHVLYSRVAESPIFLNGIHRLEKGAEQFRVALLCSEENPSHCHRRLLVGHVLAGRGTALDHIRGDGRIQSETELISEEARLNHDNGQTTLFKGTEENAWRSIQSVLQKERRPSSSER
jgi:uncharacterized protein (DUF488 family)